MPGLPAWDLAACARPGVDPAWFTDAEDAAEADTYIGLAKRVCRTCPIELDCRAWAVATSQPGIYGGRTESERLGRRRRRRRPSPSPSPSPDLQEAS